MGMGQLSLRNSQDAIGASTPLRSFSEYWGPLSSPDLGAHTAGALLACSVICSLFFLNPECFSRVGEGSVIREGIHVFTSQHTMRVTTYTLSQTYMWKSLRKPSISGISWNLFICSQLHQWQNKSWFCVFWDSRKIRAFHHDGKGTQRIRSAILWSDLSLPLSPESYQWELCMFSLYPQYPVWEKCLRTICWINEWMREGERDVVETCFEKLSWMSPW